MAAISFHCAGCGIYRVNESRCADCRRLEEIHSRRYTKPKSPTMYNPPVVDVTVNPYKIKDTILVGDKLRGRAYVYELGESGIWDVVVANISGREYRLEGVTTYGERNRIYYDELAKEYHRYDKDSHDRIDICEDRNWNEHNVKVGDLFIHNVYCSGYWVEVTGVFSRYIDVVKWKSFSINISEDELRRTFERRK